MKPAPGGLRQLDLAATWLLATVALAAVATLAAHPWPPSNDASSHVATAWIAHALAGGDPFVGAHYSFDALPLPYWLPTLLMAPLVGALGPLGALQLLLALYAVGLILVVDWLLRLVAPDNRVLAPAAALGVFHWAYWLGEIPFVVGQPLALLGFALFLGLRSALSLRMLAFLVVAALTYGSHIFALCALLGACACTASWWALRARHRWTAAHGLALGWALALFAAAAWLVLGDAAGGEGTQGRLVFDPSPWRLAQLATHPLGSPTSGRLLPFATVAALVALCGLALARGGRRALTPELALPAVAFAALAWLGPAGIEDPMGFEDIGERFALIAFLLALGAVRLPPSPRLRAAALVVVAGLCAWRIADAWAAHRDYQAPASRLATLLDEVPEEARLLPLYDVAHQTSQSWSLHRFGNWVVPLRRGYSPHVFARTGQQPLRHLERAEYRQVHDLAVTDEEWRSFGWILVQSDADEPRVPGLSSRADRVGGADGFSLWRVRPR